MEKINSTNNKDFIGKSVEFLCYFNIAESINPNSIIKCEIYYDMLTDRFLFYINSRLLSNNELRFNFVPH